MKYPLLLIAGLFVGTAALPVWAHQVQVQEDVGATLHIEPDDIPLAGAPSELWFALTQAGGTVIPLAACDCALTLYDSSETAIANPSLVPVSAEGYDDIPGALVTFPEVGAYELVLTGGPLEGEQFTPFELRFEVTVAGQAATAPAAAETDSETEAVPATEQPDAGSSEPGETARLPETPPSVTSSFPWRRLAFGSGAVLVVGVLWGIIGGLRSPGGKG